MDLAEYWAKKIESAKSFWAMPMAIGRKIEHYWADGSLLGHKDANKVSEVFLRYAGLSTNDFFVYVDNIMPMLVGKQPRFAATKYTDGSGDNIPFIEELCAYYYQVRNVGEEIKLAAQSALMYPFGAIKTSITDVKKRKTSMRYIPPSNILVDNTARSFRESDIDWIAEKKSLSITECGFLEMNSMKELNALAESDGIPEEYVGAYKVDFWEIWCKTTKRTIYYCPKTKKVHLVKDTSRYFSMFSTWGDRYFPYTFLVFNRQSNGMPIAPMQHWRRRVFAHSAVVSALADSLLLRAAIKMIYDSGSADINEKKLESFLRSMDVVSMGIDYANSSKPELISSGNVNARPLQVLDQMMRASLMEETGITRIERGLAPGSRETATYTAGVMQQSRSRSGEKITAVEGFVGTVFTKAVEEWSLIGYDYPTVNGERVDMKLIFPCKISVLSSSMAAPNQLLDLQALESGLNLMGMAVKVGAEVPGFNLEAAINLISESLNLKRVFEKKDVVPENNEGPSPDDVAKRVMETVPEEEIKANLNNPQELMRLAAERGA